MEAVVVRCPTIFNERLPVVAEVLLLFFERRVPGLVFYILNSFLPEEQLFEVVTSSKVLHGYFLDRLHRQLFGSDSD